MEDKKGVKKEVKKGVKMDNRGCNTFVPFTPSSLPIHFLLTPSKKIHNKNI
ncbi:MAG: hypothetical protein IIY87_01960 [Bacteroidales bacterium]|nr:hypothetical protein [Bacteroidales bacterium]